MTYQQEARNFIKEIGLERAERIADASYPFYSPKTASYYATNKNHSISIKHLKKALIEYKDILGLEGVLTKKRNAFDGARHP